MADVVPISKDFVTAIDHGEPNEEIVAKLEMLLKDAQSGFMRGLAYACVSKDEEFKTNWAGDCKSTLLSGAVCRLQHEFMTAVLDQDQDDG